MVSSTDTSLTKIEVFRSGLTSRSSSTLMPLVRDSASNTILRLASRNCRVTGLVNFALSEGSASVSFATCSLILRCSRWALPFFGFSSKTCLTADSAPSVSRFLSRASAPFSAASWRPSICSISRPSTARLLPGWRPGRVRTRPAQPPAGRQPVRCRPLPAAGSPSVPGCVRGRRDRTGCPARRGWLPPACSGLPRRGLRAISAMPSWWSCWPAHPASKAASSANRMTIRRMKFRWTASIMFPPH